MGLSFLRNWSLAHALRLTLRVQTGKVNKCSSTVRDGKVVSVDFLFFPFSLFWGQAANLKIPHKERVGGRGVMQ
jgi:hypothetical protein